MMRSVLICMALFAFLSGCSTGLTPVERSAFKVGKINVEVMPFEESFLSVDYTPEQVKEQVDKALNGELSQFVGVRVVDVNVRVDSIYVPAVGAMLTLGAFSGSPQIKGVISIADASTNEILLDAEPIASFGTGKSDKEAQTSDRMERLALGFAEEIARAIARSVQPTSG